MSRLAVRRFSKAVFILLLCGFSGCFSANEEQIAAGKELIATPALPEETLLQNATEAYDRGLFSLAKDSWTQLRDGYPQGPYAVLAELKIADSNFFAEDYPAAVAAYEEFLRLHPQNEGAAYVQYQIGQAYQEQSRGNDRDPTPMKQALHAYEQILSRYPNSGFVVQATTRIAECEEALETHERLIAEFYERTGKTVAAEKRFQALAAQKREAKARRTTMKIQEQSILKDDGIVQAEDLPEGETDESSSDTASTEDQGGTLALTPEGMPIEHVAPHRTAAAAAPDKNQGAGPIGRPPGIPRPVGVEMSGQNVVVPLQTNELLADLRCERIANTPVVTLLYRSLVFSTGKKLPRWSVVEQGGGASKPDSSQPYGPVKTLNKQLALPTAGMEELADQKLTCDLDGIVKITAMVRPENRAEVKKGSDVTPFGSPAVALLTLSFPSTLNPVIVPMDRPYRLMLIFRSNAPVTATAKAPASPIIRQSNSAAKDTAAENSEPGQRSRIASPPAEPVEERDF